MKTEGGWSPSVMERILKLAAEGDSIFGDDVVFTNQQGSKVDVTFRSATFSVRVDQERLKEPADGSIPVIISIANHGQDLIEWKGDLPLHDGALSIAPLGISTNFSLT